MIQNAGWGWGPASNGKTLFTGPARSCCQLGGERSHLSGDGGAVWGERGQRCEVVAAPADERQRGGKQLLLTSEREWLLARIAERPDLTLRAVVAELAERDTAGELRRSVALFQTRRDQF